MRLQNTFIVGFVAAALAPGCWSWSFPEHLLDQDAAPIEQPAGEGRDADTDGAPDGAAMASGGAIGMGGTAGQGGAGGMMGGSGGGMSTGGSSGGGGMSTGGASGGGGMSTGGASGGGGTSAGGASGGGGQGGMPACDTKLGCEFCDEDSDCSRGNCNRQQGRCVGNR